MRLRVASYNLRGMRDDTAAAAAAVRAIDPDVLLLQEVPRYPGSSYAISAFARETDLLWAGRTRLVSGTSLMTSLRVDSTPSTDRKLAVGWQENPRSYTVARVRPVGGDWVTVASVHLPLIAEQRMEHARAILAGLPADGPLVIGGDLNEQPGNPAWELLASTLDVVTDERPTFPSVKPRVRIDAVLARGEQHATPADQQGMSPSALLAPALAEATDHLPIWVDLDF